MENRKSGFGTAALVLGIIGISTSFIPIVNNASFILGILACIFGLVSLIKRKSKGVAIVGAILGILAIVITCSLQESWGKELDELTGDATEEILTNDVDVEFGEFTVETADGYITKSKLEVTVTNKGDETSSFDITIEALNENGERIDTDTVYVSDLGAGSKSKEEAFTLVFDEDEANSLKNATFNVAEISKY